MSRPTISNFPRPRATGLGIALLLPLLAVAGTMAFGAPQGATDAGPPPAKKTPSPYLSVVAPDPLRFQKPDTQNPPGKSPSSQPPAKAPGAHDPSGDVVVTPGLPAPADRPPPEVPVGPAPLRDTRHLPPSAATYTQQ